VNEIPLASKERNMRFSLLSRNTDFSILFSKQAEIAVSAATYFAEIASRGVYDEGVVQKMRNIEHQADEVAHEIIDKLNKTFITNYDREDIFALTMEFDNVVDLIYTITNRMKVYKIREINQDLVEFSYIIEKSVKALSGAIKGLRNFKNHKSTLDFCIEVYRNEKIGDKMWDANIKKLFETEKDPIKLIKWKEIFQFAEEILDICEDVANIVETIIVKQS
jgi:uncharacterized protein